jgi:tripartite-type tricarboxylate transporter receptor subunit TctC
MRTLVFVLILLCGAMPALGAAQAPAASFAGKTIYILIGFGPGGANDVWARTIALHLGNHLPGRPRVVPQIPPARAGSS